MHLAFSDMACHRRGTLLLKPSASLILCSSLCLLTFAVRVAENGLLTDHLFADAKHPRKKNAKVLFWRLEFQKRGTLHLHSLVWIDRVDALDMKRFSASMPQHHPVVAHNVLCHQRSSKPPLGIQISSIPTHGKNEKIVYQRNKFDDQNNIGPYVDTIVMSLRSHMDVQCTDGYSMLLQYVSL